MNSFIDRLAVSSGSRQRTVSRFFHVYLTVIIASLLPSLAKAEAIDGFTEPYRTTEVAAVETGTIKAIEVREGEAVERGQIVARLDDEVYLALLAIADEASRAQGQLKSAEAELAMRRQRHAKLKELRSEGHARQEEVERAGADLAISEAQLLSANESLHLKRLEYEKVRVQLERRVVRSPIDGVVNILHKDEGEFVAPNDPHVLEVVQLDPLLATFSVPSYEAARLKKGQSVMVYLEDLRALTSRDIEVRGAIEVIAPVTDAESGTVRVKVRIPNENGIFRSGERCNLRLDAPASTVRP